MSETDDLTLICGVTSIAAALKLTEAQVHHARRMGGLRFIWKEPGLGIVTSRAMALKYLQMRAKMTGAMDDPEPLDNPEPPPPSSAHGDSPQAQAQE